MLYHTFNSYQTDDQSTIRRHAVASLTWVPVYGDPDIMPRYHEIHPNDRTSSDLGDNRCLPYVKDIVEYSMDVCEDANDGIILTNADTCIIAEYVPILRGWLKRFGCGYSLRFDLPVINRPLPKHLAEMGSRYPGADLFTFTRKWWDDNKEKWPDLLLGCEGWDWVMKQLMEASGFKPDFRIIYHERHPAAWKQTLTTSPGQKHNRAEVFAWAIENGYRDKMIKKPPASVDSMTHQQLLEYAPTHTDKGLF